jgi:hypothetical protein
MHEAHTHLDAVPSRGREFDVRDHVGAGIGDPLGTRAVGASPAGKRAEIRPRRPALAFANGLALSSPASCIPRATQTSTSTSSGLDRRGGSGGAPPNWQWRPRPLPGGTDVPPEGLVAARHLWP